MYDLRGDLSNMREVCLCQLLKDFTINHIFCKRSATVQQGARERQDIRGRFTKAPQGF